MTITRYNGLISRGIRMLLPVGGLAWARLASGNGSINLRFLRISTAALLLLLDITGAAQFASAQQRSNPDVENAKQAIRDMGLEPSHFTLANPPYPGSGSTIVITGKGPRPPIPPGAERFDITVGFYASRESLESSIKNFMTEDVKGKFMLRPEEREKERAFFASPANANLGTGQWVGVKTAKDPSTGRWTDTDQAYPMGYCRIVFFQDRFLCEVKYLKTGAATGKWDGEGGEAVTRALAASPKLSEEATKLALPLAQKLAQALTDPRARPTLTLDRQEGSPGSALRVSASKGFQRGKKLTVYWDESILEDDCRVDSEGRIAVFPQRDDARSAPWLWLFIPKNASLGAHRLHATQEGGLETEPVTVRVYQPTMKQLADDFDAILERYKKDVPANPNSRNGYTWNITRAFADPAFKCGDYQDKVLYFLTDLLFNEDLAARRLMDGFDFGPLMSGPTEIRFTHHFVVIWPRGRQWPRSGVFMDPWPIQRPQALVLRPDAPPETAWWRACYQYQPEFKGRGLFIDRTTLAEYTSTPRADTLTSPGVHYPTHSDNPAFNYSDFVHGKKTVNAVLPTGPAIPPTSITIHCPVNVLVVDRQTGKRLGSADGVTLLHEIPDGFCEMGEAGGAKHWRFGLPAGAFDVKITPYRAGEFHAAVIRSKEESLSEFPPVAVTVGQTAAFRVEGGAASTLTTSDGRQLTAIVRSLAEPPEAGSESGTPSSSTAWLIGIGVATLVLLSASALLVRRLRNARGGLTT
jgi:hypothetical protein